MFDWSGVYFQKVVKVESSFITLGYVAFMSSMAAGRFIADWLVTKFGVKPIIQFSGLIIAVGLLTAVIFPFLITATIGFFTGWFRCILGSTAGIWTCRQIEIHVAGSCSFSSFHHRLPGVFSWAATHWFYSGSGGAPTFFYSNSNDRPGYNYIGY
jgi:MFS family permease